MLTIVLLNAQLFNAQLTFNTLDSVFAYADRNSASSRISTQQSLLAKWTKVAALANTINFKSPVSFSATDNLQLPVSFLPAEAFGGASGTFRQITLGQQFVNNFNLNPQIDLINPQNWARVKSAELNKEMTEINNQLNKKALHESITAAYFNCISLSEQNSVSKKSLELADTLTMIIKNKYELGIAREQDLNNAKVNYLNVKDKLQQLETNYKQQINALKILCDIPANMSINLSNTFDSPENSVKSTNTLESKYTMLQNQYMKSELKVNRMSMLPVLSLVYYQGWQQNSNAGFFDDKAKWIPSKYVGLRITVPFPPDVTKLSQNYTNKVNYRISALNASHVQLQNEMSNRNLDAEVEKNSNTLSIAQQIFELKNSNYQKSINQYKAGILPTENLLSSFSDLLNAELGLISARAGNNYSKAKLLINNSLK